MDKNQHVSKYFVLNRKGKRPYNEDRYVCKTNLHKLYFNNQTGISVKSEERMDFYSVFDGHGGAACAEYLKDNFVNFLLRSKNL
jgi:serine/threonine protein phosphatase PrpC